MVGPLNAVQIARFQFHPEEIRDLALPRLTVIMYMQT